MLVKYAGHIPDAVQLSDGGEDAFQGVMVKLPDLTSIQFGRWSNSGSGPANLWRGMRFESAYGLMSCTGQNMVECC